MTKTDAYRWWAILAGGFVLDWTGKERVFPEREVWLLGAGFSRAISSSMPLTQELGRAALERLSEHAKNQIISVWEEDFNFETVMSVLAANQPFLTASENLQTRSYFEDLVEAISEVLEVAQLDAIRANMPIWLSNFLYGCHHLQTVLITFNYDTLVEACFAHPDSPIGSTLPGSDRGNSWAQVLAVAPPNTPHGPMFVGDPIGGDALLARV